MRGLGRGAGAFEVRGRDQRLLKQLALSAQLLLRVASARFGDRQVGDGAADLLGRAALLGLERAHLRRGARRAALRLHRVDPREHLAGLHPIAFGDRQADDLAHHAGADVGVPHRDDLARRGDGRSEPRLTGDGAHIHCDARRSAAGHEQRRAAEHDNGQHDDEPSISSHAECEPCLITVPAF